MVPITCKPGPLDKMTNQYLILVADRNPRIRDFVQRELKAEGYRVYTVANLDQLKNWVSRPGQLDILVIDPNMSGLENRKELEGMLISRPAMPVIFHSAAPESIDPANCKRPVIYIEKSGQSVDVIKAQISTLFGASVAG